MAKPKPFTSISLCLALLASMNIVRAADSPCMPQPTARQLAFNTERGSDASLDNERELDVAFSRQRFRFVPRGNEDITFGYGHEYTTIDIDPLPGAQPSSNGHLHRLYVPIDATGLVKENWILRLQPAVSISSNLLKHPGQISGDALQFNIALLKQWSDAGWRTGICGDYRFGEYRLYPVVSRTWQSGDWSLTAGFPDSALEVYLDTNLTAGVRFSPDGNRWSIHDPDLRDTVYRYEGWQLDAWVGWRFHRRWQAQWHIGYRFMSRHELVLDDGTRFRSDTNAPWHLGLTLHRYLSDLPRE